MTQKELLYLEDAIGHEKSIISIIDQSMDIVEDTNIKNYFETEKTCHQNTVDNLMSVLEKNNAWSNFIR